MLSKLEDAILRSRTGSRGFRDILFELLDGSTLRSLRSVSRVLRGPVDDQSERMFGQLFVRSPLPGDNETWMLEKLAHFCRHLTITVARTRVASTKHHLRTRSPSRNSHEASRHGMDLVQSIRQMLSLERQNMHRTRSDSLDSYLLPRPLLCSSSPPKSDTKMSISPTRITKLDREAHDSVRQRWIDLISRFHQLCSLTLRVYGDRAWPGRTEVEEQLVDIRVAIEYATLPKLRHFCLNPVHAMGVIHLIWSGLGTVGEARAARGDVWHGMDFLDIHILNPLATGQLTTAQQIMFKKLLFEYLKSFASAIRRLRIVWLDAPGPSPLTLHLEPGLEQRPPIRWPRLEELWVGNITLPHQTIRLVPQLAPSVTQLKQLRSVRRDSYLEMDDPSAWINVVLNQPPRTGQDEASSVYSQSASMEGSCGGGISRTSKSIPIMLDL